ncbi:MAG: Nudix family hydrolase [Gammaproteobacteria bacterium]|nr:Nudix family hydrolase [Gammaproteobacteria bacterium]
MTMSPSTRTTAVKVLNSEVIHVAAAAIVNSNNEILISRRAADVHQGGLWEFPGGKLESGELVQQALLRELDEELGISAASYRPLIKVTHQYPDKTVLLDVWKVDNYTGQAIGREGQTIRWQPVEQLDQAEFPAADVAVIQALNLPEHYLITGKFKSLQDFEQRLGLAIDKGIRLAQLRLTNDWVQSSNEKYAAEIIKLATDMCEQARVRLMFNIPDKLNHIITPSCLHLNSRKLQQYAERPDCNYLSVSCHNVQEMVAAQKLGVDFMVLSPVQATATHPEITPLGWDSFSEMIAQVNVPVYALGGVSRSDTEKAWLAGAQGIAAIGGLWNPS